LAARWLIVIVVIGMLQNTWAAAAAPIQRKKAGLGVQPAIYEIRGVRSGRKAWRERPWDDIKAFCDEPPNHDNCVGVMRALVHLEKFRPGAGGALLPVFFPSNLSALEERCGTTSKTRWNPVWPRSWLELPRLTIASVRDWRTLKKRPKRPKRRGPASRPRHVWRKRQRLDHCLTQMKAA
jgi:hypothetical protein